MAERICPACGRGVLTRCGRNGLWENHVLPLFGVFPWRCGRCRTRFRLSDRGIGFQRLPAKPDYFDEVARIQPSEQTGAEATTAVTQDSASVAGAVPADAKELDRIA